MAREGGPMSKKRKGMPPKPVIKIRPRPEQPPVYFHFVLRDLADLAWLASPTEFHRLAGLLQPEREEWEDDVNAQLFFSFPTKSETIVCLNTEYVQLAQMLDEPPMEIVPAPPDRVRLWLYGQPHPRILSVQSPERFSFRDAADDVEGFEQWITWNNEHRYPVILRLDEVVALEYPAHWGTEAEVCEPSGYDEIDMIPF